MAALLAYRAEAQVPDTALNAYRAEATLPPVQLNVTRAEVSVTSAVELQITRAEALANVTGQELYVTRAEVSNVITPIDGGPDQSVESYDIVTLSAFGVNPTWTQTAGMPTVVLTGTNVVTFEAPPTMEGTTLTFRVTDEGVYDTVIVTVAPHSYWVRRSNAWTPRNIKARKLGAWV